MIDFVETDFNRHQKGKKKQVGIFCHKNKWKKKGLDVLLQNKQP